MKNIEILAPAGNLNALKVAINSGANAVYIGASKFNARAGATNFSIEELKMGVEYAHIFGAKVYLTVNTIIKNEEFSEVIELIDQCVQIGIDAFIVQDMGLANCLLNKYENIELHASTQMAVHNLYGAKILEKLGFKRVVLSRECSLQDIIEIQNNTNLEIEYFVHGALCVSFSGNCYLSSLCSGCSGNRGKCKQYCRLPYTAFKNNEELKTGYLLSPSDQCLIERVNELYKAGVNSFKIEGRLKKESYIASAVNAYKNAINGALNPKDKQTMQQIFSRGEFNTGKYVDLQNHNIINYKINNHSGITIGKVESVKKFKDIFKIGIICNHNLTKGDALKFFENENEICSLGVGNVEQQGNIQYVFSKNKPKLNSVVNLIVNKELEDSVLPKQLKLPVEMLFVGYSGTNAVLTIKTGEHKVTVKSNFILEGAKNIAVTEQELKNNLSKLNETYFELTKFNAKIDDVFIAKSQLNELRRLAVQQLTKQIIESKKPKVSKKQNSNQKIFELTKTQNYVVVENINQIVSSNNVFIYSPTKYCSENIKMAVDKAKAENVRLYLDLPNLARFNDVKLIDEILNNFTNNDFGIIANNLYAFNYSNKFEIVAGLGLNIINDHAKNFYMQLGATDCFYSIEANIKDISKNAVVYTYGQPVVMTLTHCPIKMLFKNNCANCKYCDNIKYKGENNKTYYLRRKRIKSCYFELVAGDCVKIEQHNFRTICDNRTKLITGYSTGMINKNI